MREDREADPGGSMFRQFSRANKHASVATLKFSQRYWNTHASEYATNGALYSFDPCIYNIISYELFFPFFFSLSYFLSPRNFTLYNTILNLQKNVAMREKLDFSREIAIAARFLFSD